MVNLVSNMGEMPTSGVCASTSAKNSNSTPKATTSPIMDGTPFRVSVAPEVPIGEEVGDGKEGEKIYNSPSFVDVLKMILCHSPPLNRGGKSHKEH
jgi:hypothetical protein